MAAEPIAKDSDTYSWKKSNWFFIALLFLLAFLYGRPGIFSDGVTYYALTHSLISDFDFDLQNQAELLKEVRIRKRAGRVASIYSCGFALLYAPFFLFFDLFRIDEWRPYQQNEIFPISDSLAVLTASSLFSILTVFLTARLIARVYGVSPWNSWLMSLLVFLGTPLIFYGFTDPSFSHASDAFLTTLAVTLAVSPHHTDKDKLTLRNIALGFVLSLSVLLRNANVLLVPFMVGYALWNERRNSRNRFRAGAAIVMGAVPMALIQAHFNLTQYGSILTSGYTSLLKFDPVQRISTPETWNFVLADPARGLYIWSPVTLLSTVGIVWAAKNRDAIARLALVCVVVVVLTFQFFAPPWIGASFGQRLLTHLFVFWTIGLHHILQFGKRFNRFVVPAIVLISVLFSFTLFNAHYINGASPAVRTELRAIKQDDSPIFRLRMLQRSISMHNNPNVAGIWFDSLCSAPHPSVFCLPFTDAESNSPSPIRRRLRRRAN